MSPRLLLPCMIALALGSGTEAIASRGVLAAGRPAAIVIPNQRLHDGEVVTVRVGGFGNGQEVWLSECASAAVASDAGCGPQLPQQTLLVTNARGAGSVRFRVRSRAATKPYNTHSAKRCAPSSCVIVATRGFGSRGRRHRSASGQRRPDPGGKVLLECRPMRRAAQYTQLRCPPELK